MEDGDVDNYDNQVLSSAELYGTGPASSSEQRGLNVDHSSQSHVSVEVEVPPPRHVIHDPATAARHSTILTSLQVR